MPELVLAVADCVSGHMPIKKGTFHSENVHRWTMSFERKSSTPRSRKR